MYSRQGGGYTCQGSVCPDRAKAHCMLILVPIPALGMGNIASVLSPKGKPVKGSGLRVGTKGTDGEGEGWERRRQPGSCQPSWEGEELDVGYPRQEIGVFH